jgi:hypothetical protein
LGARNGMSDIVLESVKEIIGVSFRIKVRPLVIKLFVVVVPVLSDNPRMRANTVSIEPVSMTKNFDGARH